MANARSSHLLRQVRTLFNAGTITGSSDAQLLEQFASRSAAAVEDTLAAEAAFEILIARHGPMVLGVCRRALSDERDIDDAFQAIFLVLVRRASSVRAGDSLGRWLYGVARKVAARARVRSQRERLRATSLDSEPTACESAADQAEVLAALDEEVSRLPEKFRAPVVLCHLEGLSHAEAADRLRWPVGTVSGRLSRARGLLKDRLARRGMSPTENSLGILLAADTIRVAVPQPLASATIRTAVGLSMGGAAPAGVASASALALMNGFLRAAVAFKLKAAATFLLALGLAGVVAAGAGNRAQNQGFGSEPAGGSQSPPRRSDPHRPADEIVKEIEALLTTARRSLPQAEFDRVHGQIATLVDELRTAHADDPHLANFLPERWSSLVYQQKKPLACAEIDAVLKTTKDSALRTNALFTQTILRMQEPIDSFDAVNLAAEFASHAPTDNRAGELFYWSTQKLNGAWLVRVFLLVTFTLAGALIAGTSRPRPRRWLKIAVRLGELVLALLVVLVGAGRLLLDEDRQIQFFGLMREKLSAAVMSEASSIFLWLFSGSLSLTGELSQQLAGVVRSGRFFLAVVLAVATARALVVARKRLGGAFLQSVSTIRLSSLGLIAALAVYCGIDACLVGHQRHLLLDRIVREYPDSFRGRLVLGERRQYQRLGEPFELGFSDAITSRPISMEALRGKVVVVDFWATWCGPCVGEIPELKDTVARTPGQLDHAALAL